MKYTIKPKALLTIRLLLGCMLIFGAGAKIGSLPLKNGHIDLFELIFNIAAATLGFGYIMYAVITMDERDVTITVKKEQP